MTARQRHRLRTRRLQADRRRGFRWFDGMLNLLVCPAPRIMRDSARAKRRRYVRAVSAACRAEAYQIERLRHATAATAEQIVMAARHVARGRSAWSP